MKITVQYTYNGTKQRTSLEIDVAELEAKGGRTADQMVRDFVRLPIAAERENPKIDKPAGL